MFIGIMMKLKKNFSTGILIFGLLFIAQIGFSQTDSLYYKNGEVTVGEIKQMNRGVVIIETAYSDSDFAVEWDKVYKIKSQQSYLITLSNGNRFNGTINSTDVAEEVQIIANGASVKVSLVEIVQINPVDDSFWDKFSASVDVNLSLTKAKSLTQFSARGHASYTTAQWKLDGGINSVYSSQDSVADTKRTDANISFRLFMQKGWSVILSNEFLQNDEQQLELRSTAKVGLGYYIIQTNSVYFGALGGLALNSETFTEDINPQRNSGEVFLGLEFNMYNTGDLSLLTNAIVYPSFTETGRVRFDYKFDIKYDLPLDFYIKVGTTINYDNQPVPGAADLDYVIQSGIGWEW